MNDKAYCVLLRFLEEWSEPPGFDWPEEEKAEVTFSRWTAEELIGQLLDHPLVPAEDIIEEFIIKMEIYAAMPQNHDCGRIFSIAAETAKEFLELI